VSEPKGDVLWHKIKALLQTAERFVVILVLSSSVAEACGALRTTNLAQLRWAYCSEDSTVTIKNNSPYSIRMDFTVYYVDRHIPGTWEDEVASGKYITVPANSAAMGVKVTGLKMMTP
jgi:hypothetical protein